MGEYALPMDLWYIESTNYSSIRHKLPLYSKILFSQYIHNISPNSDHAPGPFRTKLDLYIFYCVISNKDDTLDSSDFERFEITQELIDTYTTIYWQQDSDKVINRISIRNIEY